MNKLMLILVLLMSSLALAEPPEEPANEEKGEVALEDFDHNAHLDLGVECEACHVETGKPQLRENSCADCH